MRKYWTKKRKNQAVRKACCIVFCLSFTAGTAIFNQTNEITIPTEIVEVSDEVPPLVFKPLAVEVSTPEIKEKAVVTNDYNDLAGIKKEVKDYIIEITTAKDLNTKLYLDIANCESGFNPKAKNSTSTATGVFQFLQGTWQYVNQKRELDWTLDDRLDYKKNTDNAIWLLENEGATHWECYTKNMF